MPKKAKKAEKEEEAGKEVEEGGGPFFQQRSSYVGLIKEEGKEVGERELSPSRGVLT